MALHKNLFPGVDALSNSWYGDEPSMSGILCFMELEIISRKYGRFIVKYDEQDHDLISKYHWYPVVLKGNVKSAYAAAVVHYDKATQKTKKSFMHNVIMGCRGIDHIDSDGMNNQRSNLRVATQAQNAKNQSVKWTNKFGLKGVSYDKKKNSYGSFITFNYRHIFLGYYHSLIDASNAYNEAAKLYFGEFAKLNVMTDERKSELMKLDLPVKIKRGKNLATPKGVSMCAGRYMSRITINGKTVFLGLFDSMDDAANAYLLAKSKNN